MKKYRIIYGIVMAAVFFCGLWGGTALALFLTGWLAVLLLLSGMGLYFGAGRLHIFLAGERTCRSGQAAELKLMVVSPRWYPAGDIQVRLREENHVFGTIRESVYVLELGRGNQHEYSISLDTTVCGTRYFYLDEMVAYDLLKLFSRRRAREESFVHTVYPYEAQMYISLQRHREREQPGDMYDGKKSGTDISEVFGLREYREGDPLQSIHWKLSGKMRQLIVREFGRPVNYHTLLLLSPALRYGKREVLASVASAVFDLGVSMSRALLNQNMAHFVGYCSGGELFCIPVDSANSYEEMLMKLMHCPMQRNGEETMLSFMNQQMYRQYTKVVYVTGLVDEAAAQNLAVLADLTILQAADGHPAYLTSGPGYTVVRVSTENIRKMEHSIPI